jgi:hypothetical protein
MNDQEKMNALRQGLTLFFGMLTIAMPWLATSQQYATLTTVILTIVPAAVSGYSVCWSIYAHWNMKKVPETSTAIALPGGAQMVGTTVGAVTAAAAKVVGALLIGFLVLSLSPPAMAANNLPFPLKPIIAPAPAAAPADPFAQLMSSLEKVKQEDIAGVIADIQAADVDAATVVIPAIPATGSLPASDAVVRDPISHACYPAEIKFLQSLPQAATPTGKFILVQLFQAKRDFIAQIQAGLPTYLKLGCAPLLGDEINTFVQTMALVGVKLIPAALTGIFPAAAPITLPLMTLTP